MITLTCIPIPSGIIRKGSSIAQTHNHSSGWVLRKVLITLVCIVLTIALTGCKGWSKPKDPENPDSSDLICSTSPCSELDLQYLSGNRGSVEINVRNIGNKATSGYATVTATFSRTGWQQSVEVGIRPLSINDSQSRWIYSDWRYSLGEPEELLLTVNAWEDEKDKRNNSLRCHWQDEGMFWNCDYLTPKGTVQLDTGESTTSDSIQLLQNAEEPSAYTIADDHNKVGQFEGKYIGRADGIDDTFAPFGVEFTGTRVRTDFLPGMRLSACGSSGPVYPYVEEAGVTVTGNRFTTGPLETNNKATVTLSGTLSDDAQLLNLQLDINPEDCDQKTIAATAHRVSIPMNLSLEVGAHPDRIYVGQNLQSAIHIKNIGLVTAQDAILYATFPADLKLLTPSGITCMREGENQVCSILVSKIDPGNSHTLNLKFDTVNIKTKALATSFELVVEGDPTLDIAPGDNLLMVSYPVTFVSDFSITEFALVNPPATLYVGEETTVTFVTTVNNAGPSKPISARLMGTALAPTDSKSVPTEPSIALFDLAAPRTIQQTFTVNCGEVSNHTFSFITEIHPRNAEDMDPDLSNNRAATTLTVECIFPVDLSSVGWHLISIPVVPQEPYIENFLTEIAGRYSKVLSFEEGGLSYVPALPGFSTLTTIGGMHGYWIFMEQNGFLNVRGQPQALDTPIQLEKGWNLVSYLPKTPLPVAHALVSIAGKYDKVLGYDRGAISYYAALQPPLNTLQVMKRGMGYWIHMTEAGTLNYAQASSAVQSATTVAANQPQNLDGIGATSHWINVYSTNSIYNGEPLPIGTTVTAIGEDGRVLGQVAVREAGWYGVLAVYGTDDSNTKFKGARVGEKIRFLINGKLATINNGYSPMWTGSGDLFEVDLEIFDPSDSHNIFLPNVQQ